MEIGWQQLIPILVLMILMVVIFWHTVIRPQVKTQKRHESMVKALQVGDRIITAGGIHGEIVAVAEDTFTLEVAPGVRLVFDRKAVRRKLS